VLSWWYGPGVGPRAVNQEAPALSGNGIAGVAIGENYGIAIG